MAEVRLQVVQYSPPNLCHLIFQESQGLARQTEEFNIYVLNFRYIGGCRDSAALQQALQHIGWVKIADLTSCYALRVPIATDDPNLHQNEVEQLLSDYRRADQGGRVSYGISKYIPRNQ